MPASGCSRRTKLSPGRRPPGNKIVGISFTGVHSNGLSLARSVVEKYAGYDKKFKGKKSFGQELLTPTRIYSEVLKVTAKCTVHGMCHVTGGGLLNFNRLRNNGFVFDNPIKPPAIFGWMQKAVTSRTRRCTAPSTWAWAMPTWCRRSSVACITKMVPGAGCWFGCEGTGSVPGRVGDNVILSSFF